MKIQEYLSHIPNDEITKRLRLVDQSLMELHEHGLYVVCNISEIEIINNEITLASFKNKIDYLNSGYNPHGDKKDILELCSIGICAYNHFNEFYSSPDFISNLIDNLDQYINNGKVPRVMREYYVEVLARGNIIYLNIFLLKTDIDMDAKQIDSDSGRERGYTKTKYNTAVGRQLSGNENEAAFARVLVLPALLALVYLVVLICYFIFYK